MVHYILTHFQWFWDCVNNSFLQDIIMRLVLTGRRQTRFITEKKCCKCCSGCTSSKKVDYLSGFPLINIMLEVSRQPQAGLQ